METMKNSVETISVDSAIELLQRSQERGREIQHMVSVTRHPDDPSRILAINAVESQ